MGSFNMTSEDPDKSLVTISQRQLAELTAQAAENASLREKLAELQARLDREVPYLREEIKHERDLRTLTGSGPAMKGVRTAIQQVARTDSTVLILGETGTGKELVARAIHQLSPRRERLLVTVNCAALNANIIASELFGHEQGAFTGASKRRIGRFELAHQGSIFLDEIAEIPAETQVMLLRVLQERIIERVGGTEPIGVDVRVIAATHQDLGEAVRVGKFRTDLFYRLNVFPIHVPPLRERREDIPDLIQHFLHMFNRRLGKKVEKLEAGSMQLLLDYHWPGNVRELENLIERAMIVSAGEVLRIDPGWLLAAVQRTKTTKNSRSLKDLELQAIVAALERCRGKIYGPGGAAAALGVKPTTLYGKLRKHGIKKNSANQQ
jgi:formate hydrogenlyase transcriptional activator